MSEKGIYTLAKKNKICRINSNLTMQIKFGSKTKNWILWSSKEILSGLEMNRATQENKKK